MIVGLGIDSVEIDRVAHWSTFKPETLARLFTQEEIAYCLSVSGKSAERLAVRLALKEAFYKAFSMWQPNHAMPFLTLAHTISLAGKKNHTAPTCTINWKTLSVIPIQHHISVTHTSQVATACLILEQI